MKTKKLIITTAIMLCAFLFSISVEAQPRKAAAAKEKGEKKEQVTKAKKKDNKPKKLEDFLTKDLKVMDGMTPVIKKDGKYYLNITEEILDKEIIMVTRIAKAAAGAKGMFTGYAGDPINKAVFTFTMGENDKIYLKKQVMNQRVDDPNSTIKESFEKSNLQPITEALSIVAQSEDKKQNIVEVSSIFEADKGSFYFNKRNKKVYRIGAMQKDKSHIVSINTYPINTEVRTVKTYLSASGEDMSTFELNLSFVMLPENKMTPRYHDDRVGYFTANYTDLGKNPQGVEKISMITRWRLEPKPEDMEKYKRGELVEPAKPIVFYIDPTTPKEWVPYLIQGVNDWEPVFRKAGFKNAIMGKVAPTKEEDSTWSMEDARYSAIMYMPSTTPNAMGPNVHDPRTGEIIEAHVHWYHNVMYLLRNWYFIQCSPNDPDARKLLFDQELMGQLVRFVSSHEVGHSIGLRHNFAGTAFFTTDQLRDAEFLKENGHTTSIMDYSRFNYVVQPGDNVPRELLFPRLGSYDNWAIEWGYRRFPEIDDPDKELTKINEWIIEKTKDNRYYFGTEGSPSDPRFQAEDLGINQMEANALGIKNLQFITGNLLEWTATPNKGYEDLKMMYGEVLSQYKRYIGHVAKWVGGMYEESKTVEMPGDVFIPVEKAKQKEALAWLDAQLFTPPTWIVPNEIMNKLVVRADLTMEGLYKKVFGDIFSKRVMLNMARAELMIGAKAYTMAELFEDLNGMVLSKKANSVEEAAYIRIMQKVYINAVCDIYTGKSTMMRGMFRAISSGNSSADNSDISAILEYQLKAISKDINKISGKDVATKAHKDYLQSIIEKTLTAGSGSHKK